MSFPMMSYGTKQTRNQSIQIKKRKWKWIGHTIRKDCDSVERQALFWNPQGNRRRGRLRESWRPSVKREMSIRKKTWRERKVLAENRVRWRCFVEVLCSGKSNRMMIMIYYIFIYFIFLTIFLTYRQVLSKYA